MTDPHADTHLDAALEALARPEPPGDHVGRVLARTGPSGEKYGSLLRRAAASRPPAVPLRWALPIAASLLVAASVTWIARDPALPTVVTDGVQRETDGSSAGEAERSESGPYQAWGALREIDQPVLPPEAYWAMDAFEEWRRLGRATGAASAHRQPATGNRQLTGHRPTPPAMAASRLAVDTAAARLAYAPVPSGLPPIELETIAPAPLAFVALADPAPIDLPAITLEPIVLAPLAHEERP